MATSWFTAAVAEAGAPESFGAVRANDLSKAKEPATQIVDCFARTAYAPRAALLYAKMLYDGGDKPGARAQLQWIIDYASEDEL